MDPNYVISPQSFDISNSDQETAGIELKWIGHEHDSFQFSITSKRSPMVALRLSSKPLALDGHSDVADCIETESNTNVVTVELSSAHIGFLEVKYGGGGIVSTASSHSITNSHALPKNASLYFNVSTWDQWQYVQLHLHVEDPVAATGNHPLNLDLVDLVDMQATNPQFSVASNKSPDGNYAALAGSEYTLWRNDAHFLMETQVHAFFMYDGYEYHAIDMGSPFCLSARLTPRAGNELG